MILPKILGFAAAAIGLMTSCYTHAAVIVNEQFNDGNLGPTSGHPSIDPTSLSWLSSDGNTITYNNQGKLEIYGSTNGARMAMAHFAPAGSPTTLAVGDTIQLKFQFEAHTDSGSSTGVGALGTGNLLRFGLFNTNYSQSNTSAYLTTNQSSAGRTYDGYAVAVHNSSPSTGLPKEVRADIMVRDYLKGQSTNSPLSTAQLITNSTGFYTMPSADQTVNEQTLTEFALNALYQGQLTLTRVNETTMKISSLISGNGINIRDEYFQVHQDHDLQSPLSSTTGRATFAFDTIAFSYNWNSGAGFQRMLIDNIEVTQVPEPQRAVLMLAGLSLFALRRRR